MSRREAADRAGVSITTMDEWRSLEIDPPWHEEGRNVRYLTDGFDEAVHKVKGNRRPARKPKPLTGKALQRRDHMQSIQKKRVELQQQYRDYGVICDRSYDNVMFGEWSTDEEYLEYFLRKK
jgi:hypothetical protein